LERKRREGLISGKKIPPQRLPLRRFLDADLKNCFHNPEPLTVSPDCIKEVLAPKMIVAKFSDKSSGYFLFSYNPESETELR